MNNAYEAFEILYKEANHTVMKFGDIALLDGSSVCPDFNIILNLFQGSKASEKNLKAALDRANETKRPFVFIQDEEEQSNIDFLAEHQFINIGRVTCVKMDNNDFEFKASKDKLDYKIVRVQNDEDFTIWCEITDSSFNLVKGESQRVFQASTPIIYAINSSHHCYILYDNENNATSASMLYLPKDRSLEAGHYNWCTKANYRNRGLMSYLIKEMLTIAKDNGFQTSIAQCYDTSLKLAQKIGFEAYGELNIFSNI